MGKEKEIIGSWKKNASEWIKIIDAEQIPSRRFTNEAIVQTISDLEASKILDIGCGEGWLTREVTKMGKTAVGVDAIKPLLENARKKGAESYHHLSYEEITEGKPIPEAPFGAAVFNFCLYQKSGLAQLLIQTKKALAKDGVIVIQTLHPFFLFQQGLEYKNQWIADAWNGLPGNFTDGHPWYARTLEGWMIVFRGCSLKLIQIKEVLNNEGQPLSIILTVQ